jgi:hypothetical protein
MNDKPTIALVRKAPQIRLRKETVRVNVTPAVDIVQTTNKHITLSSLLLASAVLLLTVNVIMVTMWAKDVEGMINVELKH